MTIGLFAGFRLCLGSWQIGSTVFDVNSLFLCSAFVLIGYQSVWFGILSKSFASREGLLPLDVRVERLRNKFQLERALVVSLFAGLIGLAGVIAVFLRWGANDFGILDPRSTLRLLIPSSTLIVGAAQTSLSSLMLSILALPSNRPPNLSAELPALNGSKGQGL